jgi:hypothetical protein
MISFTIWLCNLFRIAHISVTGTIDELLHVLSINRSQNEGSHALNYSLAAIQSRTCPQWTFDTWLHINCDKGIDWDHVLAVWVQIFTPHAFFSWDTNSWHRTESVGHGHSQVQILCVHRNGECCAVSFNLDSKPNGWSSICKNLFQYKTSQYSE